MKIPRTLWVEELHLKYKGAAICGKNKIKSIQAIILLGDFV